VQRESGLRDPGLVDDPRLRAVAQRDPTDRQAGGEVAFVLPAAFTPASVRAAAGSDEQGGYADRYGGFMRRSETKQGALGAASEGDPTAGRTLPVQMDAPIVEVPARSDKDHSTSAAGGLIVTRKPETVEAQASRVALEQVRLQATSLVGLSFATEELWMDSPGTFISILGPAFEDQFNVHMLKEKIRGGGGNEFLGVLNSPARVTVAKEGGQGADTIVSENVLKMAERCWGYSRALWLAVHDARRQVSKLAIEVGTAGVIPLFQPATRPDLPDMLWGRPIYFTEHCSQLGDEGDLILADWSQYLEGLYQPLDTVGSVHVRWSNHERVMKFWLRNAGAPWWRSPLTPANGANTLSPVVTLAERA
jgi:hypothetical protein